jgi:hypothetical protein
MMFARLATTLARLMISLPVLAAMTMPGKADSAMTPQEILRLAPGTFHALVKGKWQIMVTLTRDGVITGKAGNVTDTGRWTLRGAELCIVMPSFTKGRVECSEVVADSGWYRGRNVAFKPL